MSARCLFITLMLLHGVLCTSRIMQSTDSKGRWKVSLPTVLHHPEDSESSRPSTQSRAALKEKAVTKEPEIMNVKKRDKDDLVVDVHEGKLLGMKESRKGVDYYAFVGIPYASKPERFKAATPPKPWDGIRNATEEPPNCIQLDHYVNYITGEEDCLFANVDTPTLDDELLPVIVWVHGGMFKFGSGDFRRTNPNKLLGRRMVVVSFNYRLGAFGFLTTGTHHAPGNMGLKDSVMALRWVKKNIRNFGGDPNNLILLGVSTGGTQIEMLLVSPMTKGLIDKAIIMSGSLMGQWSFNKNPVSDTFALAKHMGMNSVDPDEVMQYLSSVDPAMMVNVSETLNGRKKILARYLTFVPTVEEAIPGEEAFFKEYPANLLKSGQYPDIPILLGMADLEGLFYFQYVEDIEAFVRPQDTLLEQHMPKPMLDAIESKERRNEIMTKLRKLYFKGKPVGLETLKELGDLYGDIKFACPVYASAKIRQQVNKGKVYMMLFAHSNPQSKVTRTHLKHLKGAGHSEDMQYIFSTEIGGFHQPDNETLLVIDRLLTMFHNFAMFGDPTPSTTDLLPVKWPPLSKGKVQFMKITERMEIVADPIKDRCEFWNELQKKYMKPFYY